MCRGTRGGYKAIALMFIQLVKQDLKYTSEQLNALQGLFEGVFKHGLRALTSKAIFNAFHKVVTGETHESVTCNGAIDVRTRDLFHLCMDIMFHSSQDTLSSVRRMFTRVIPNTIPSIVKIRRTCDRFRIHFMETWELENLPTGMRVSLVAAVRINVISYVIIL